MQPCRVESFFVGGGGGGEHRCKIALNTSVADPGHFGAAPDLDPDPGSADPCL
jgi:hypothetical protein